MKALVTGASGQLGAALVRSTPDGTQVTALDHAQLDVTDSARLRAAVAGAAPELIINAAAYTAVDDAESHRDLAFSVNGDAPGHLAQAASENGARLIHVSTDYVFDGTKTIPYLPGDAPNPLSAYGESKLAGERAVLESGARALVLRAAWVYAAKGRNFLNTMRRLLREREELRVVNDQFGTPTHADSLARAIWHYAELQDAQGIQHWTDGGGPISWFDFATEIRAQVARIEPGAKLARLAPIPTKDYPTPARRPLRAVLNISGSAALIGAPKTWKEELAACFAQAT